MSRARRVVLLPLAATALLITACGDDDSSPTVTQTESSPSTTEETSTDEATTTATEETPTSGEDVAAPTSFASPTGNIGCVLEPRAVRCDIAERDWEPPPPPRDCELDYGQGITLETGTAPEFVCAGDTVLGAGEELPYGETSSAGLLRCESEQSGITCLDAESGRGFTLSRAGYELF